MICQAERRGFAAIAILCALVVVLAGCTGGGADDPEVTSAQPSGETGAVDDPARSSPPPTEESTPPPQFTVKRGSIQVLHSNLFTLDFSQLQKAIADAAGVKVSQLTMPFMYDLPAIDLFFGPEGDIWKLDLSLRVLTGENEAEFLMTRFAVSDSPLSGLDDIHLDSGTGPVTFPRPLPEGGHGISELTVSPAGKEQHFVKHAFTETFDFAEFPAWVQWMDTIGLEDILAAFVPGEPVCWELLAGAQLTRAMVDGGEMTCIFLDCSSGTAKQIPYEEIPYCAPDTLYFSPAAVVDENTLKGLRYYAVIPCYGADDTHPDPYIDNILIIFPDIPAE